MLDTTIISDVNAFLSTNVPYWDRFGRYLVIFTLVLVGKALARYLVKTLKGDKKQAEVQQEKKKE